MRFYFYKYLVGFFIFQAMSLGNIHAQQLGVHENYSSEKMLIQFTSYPKTEELKDTNYPSSALQFHSSPTISVFK